MADVSVEIEIDRSDLDALVAAGVRAISRTTAKIAEVLATDEIPREAPKGATGNLSAPWPTREQDPVTWVVYPNDDAFYAHMVARGTQAHGADRAKAMPVVGSYPDAVWAHEVRGVTANPFHERAIANAENRVDDVLRDLLAEEGI